MDIQFPEESVLDLASPKAIRDVLLCLKPQVVINAGALTAVDRCETEADLATRINSDAVACMAETCSSLGALLVQISTDYVFDGTSTRPYRETDAPNPSSVYGLTKLRGEAAAFQTRNHLVVRTSWLFDAWGKNFLRTMLNAASQGRALRVVADQWGGPTSCRALARQLKTAVHEEWRGMVHATCSGETTWHGFAEEIFRKANVTADLAPCTTSEYPLPAPRPAYSVLDGARRCQFGTDQMPSWQDALEEVLQTPSI
jgi:dTDP-4-dehydrorhamnose reductase